MTCLRCRRKDNIDGRIKTKQDKKKLKVREAVPLMFYSVASLIGFFCASPY